MSKGKLTEQQKAKLLAIEEAKQLKRERLHREVDYGTLAFKRGEKKWRQMLIDLALPKVRESVEYVWHNFEKIIDRKNFVISLLMDELRESEVQYVANNKNHVDHVDKLLDLFREDIDELQNDFDNQIMELKRRNDEIINTLTLSAEEQNCYLKTMSYMLEMAKKEQRQSVRTEYFSKLELEEKKGDYLSNRLRDNLKNELQDITTHTVNFLKHYKRRTEERKKEHDRLKEPDDALQELMVTQLEKIRSKCERAKILKTKFHESQIILEKELYEMKQEHDFFNYAYCTLKRRLETDRKKDVEQITTLTVTYNETMTRLEKLRDKLKNTLLIGSLCRKLETEKEKVEPFPISYSKEEATTEETTVTSEYLPSLELFWQRVAQAEASRYSINEEKEFLTIENEILKLKLYEYLKPIVSCPVVEKNGLGEPIKNVTEGALEHKKYAKQNFPHQFDGNDSDHEIDDDE